MRVNRVLAVTLLAITAVLSLKAVPGRAATVYDVGEGKPYPSLASVPWNGLAAGDTVRVFWRPEPYREKLLIAARGTATDPIRIVGVPGPSGELPVIDGKNATTAPQFKFTYAGTQDRGLIILTLPQGLPWGYKPGYLEFSNLEVRNAHASNTYTDGTGALRRYSANAASFFVERGEHIALRNCSINGSGNGFFVASGGDEALFSRDILVQGCAIYGNGNVSSDREHNIYTEASGMVFEGNYMGPLRPGALGSNLKDRSAGTVVRYNWIEQGAHLLDLVEPEESATIMVNQPGFHETFVYGNVLYSGPANSASLVHYGGDNGNTAIYRKGCLYFYDNTVAVRCNQSGPGGWWSTALFKPETDDETVDVRSNILFCMPDTAGATPTELCLADYHGKLNLGTNWASPTIVLTKSGVAFSGSVTGGQNLFTNPTNNPGFVSADAKNFRLAVGSPCVDRGGDLAAAAASYPAACEFQTPRGFANRPAVGGMDLGAFEGEFSAGYSIRGTVRLNSTGVSGVKISAGAYQTTTLADGSYVLGGLTDGSYTVQASAANLTFSAPQVVQVGPDRSGVDFTATAQATGFRLSGKVLVDGAGEGSVTVSAGVAQAISGPDGSYAFDGLAAGVYSVSASKTGCTFQALSVNLTGDLAGADIQGTRVVSQPQPSTFSISGAVRMSGAGVAGVTVAAGDQSTTTAADGSYRLSGFPSGTYIVKAYGDLLTSGPQSVQVGPDATGIDFTAEAAYTIEGTVKANGSPVASATVTCGDRSTTTAADGTYKFWKLPAGAYTLKGAKTGLTFTDVTAQVGPSRTGVDLVAAATTFGISGTVRASGSPVAGAIVSTGTTSVTTATDGTYRLASLPAGTYTVSASKSGLSFSTRSVTVGPDAAGVDFDGTANGFTIAGKVCLANGTGVAGITVQCNSATVLTAADGSYRFSGLAAGRYTVKAYDGYYLTSDPQAVKVGPDQLSVNFSAAPAFTLEGRVTADGAPLAQATVTCGGLSVQTAADGTYKFWKVGAGTYTVSVSKKNYVFAVSRQTVTLGPSRIGVDFAGTAR